MQKYHNDWNSEEPSTGDEFRDAEVNIFIPYRPTPRTLADINGWMIHTIELIILISFHLEKKSEFQSSPKYKFHSKIFRDFHFGCSCSDDFPDNSHIAYHICEWYTHLANMHVIYAVIM